MIVTKIRSWIPTVPSFMRTANQSSLCPDVKTGVLLLHGLTGMPSEMRPLQKQLIQMGCMVECPMLPGHGGTHNDLLATGWKDWVKGARQALHRLSQDCDHVVVAGLSMGALIAALLAVDEPKVSGIVLLSITIQYDGENTNPFGILLPLVDLAPRLLGRWFWWTENPPYGLKDKRLQKQILKQVEAAKRGETTAFGLFRTYAGSLRQLMHLVKHVRREAYRIKCPALVMHSLEDTLTTVVNAQSICELMTTNEKNVVLLGGCDHVLTLDLRRKDVVNYVCDFVAKISWTRTRTARQTVASSR